MSLQSVLILTKPAPPFSMPAAAGDDNVQAVGFTMDLLYEVFRRVVLLRDLPVRVEMLADNPAVFHALNEPRCNTSSVVCIGAAAISVTGEREARQQLPLVCIVSHNLDCVLRHSMATS